jgi:SPOR domain
MARPEDSAARTPPRNGAGYDPDYTDLQGTPRTEQRRPADAQQRPRIDAPPPPQQRPPAQAPQPPRPAGPGVRPQFDPYVPQGAPRQAAPQPAPQAPLEPRRAPPQDPRQQATRPSDARRENPLQQQGYGDQGYGAQGYDPQDYRQEPPMAAQPQPRTARPAGPAQAPNQMPPTAGRPGQTQRPAAPGYPPQASVPQGGRGRAEPSLNSTPPSARQSAPLRPEGRNPEARPQDGLGADRFASGTPMAARNAAAGYEEQDEDFEDDDASGDDMMDEAEERPVRRSYSVMLVSMLIVAIAVGGGLGYAYNKFIASHKASAGGPPVVAADTTPAKIVIASTGDAGADPGKKIDDRASSTGGDNAAAAPATIVPSQEPVAVAGAQGQPADPLAGPRKVATVVVKPGEKIAAGPTDGQPVDAIPGLSIAGIDAAAAPAPQADAAANQPVKLGKPAKKMVMVAADPTPPDPSANNPAPAEPGQKTASASPKAGGNGYVIQVLSANSQQDALAFYADLQQKYGQIIGSMQPDIQQKDLGAQGIKYRLKIGPPGSAAAAHDLCVKLKAAGLKDCITAPLTAN